MNQARGSLRFGEVRGETRRFGKNCDFEVDERRRIAEPRDDVRGDIARAMFYMAERYRAQGLELFKRQAELLAEWHIQDPVDASERRRNQAIEQIQGNRNPLY